MTAALISEDHIEQLVIQELIELGYSYVNGKEISPDGLFSERQFNEVVLKKRLLDGIARLNPNVPIDAQEEAMKKVIRASTIDLFQNNYAFHKALTEGVDIEYRKDGRIV